MPSYGQAQLESVIQVQPHGWHYAERADSGPLKTVDWWYRI